MVWRYGFVVWFLAEPDACPPLFAAAMGSDTQYFNYLMLIF